MDLLVLIGLSCVMIVNNFLIFWNYQKKEEIQEILEILSHKNDKKKFTSYKVAICIAYLFLVIGNIMQSCGMGNVFDELKEISLPIKILFNSVNMIANIINIGPFLAFVIIYCHICTQIVSYLEIINQNFETCTEYNNLSNDLRNLFENGIKKANDIFSLPLFFIISSSLVSMTFNVYITIAITFNFTLNQENALSFFIVSFFSYAIFVITVLCILNFMSSAVTKSLESLYFTINSNENTVKINLKSMENFKGFDACGFFTLGKPLLTSITTNFTTYLIVLIQFKMSEIQKIS